MPSSPDPVAPVERRRQPFDTGGGRVARFVRSKVLKSDRFHHSPLAHTRPSVVPTIVLRAAQTTRQSQQEPSRTDRSSERNSRICEENRKCPTGRFPLTNRYIRQPFHPIGSLRVQAVLPGAVMRISGRIKEKPGSDPQVLNFFLRFFTECRWKTAWLGTPISLPLRRSASARAQAPNKRPSILDIASVACGQWVLVCLLV